jgi:hypothetical protein
LPAAVDNEQTVLNFGVHLVEVEDVQNGDGHPMRAVTRHNALECAHASAEYPYSEAWRTARIC